MRERVSRGYCIFQDTICQGTIPVEHDGCGRSIVYKSRKTAERSITEDVKERIDLFLQGDLDYEEAIAVEEYVEEVVVGADGVISPSRKHERQYFV